MKYTSFEIENYKGIVEKITVPLKNNLVPIIGVNGSGKTSILHAIYAFDYRNDKEYDSFHIKNLINLTQDHEDSKKQITKITATISDINYLNFISNDNNLIQAFKLDEIIRDILSNLKAIEITRSIFGNESNYYINNLNAKLVSLINPNLKKHIIDFMFYIRRKSIKESDFIFNFINIIIQIPSIKNEIITRYPYLEDKSKKNKRNHFDLIEEIIQKSELLEEVINLYFSSPSPEILGKEEMNMLSKFIIDKTPRIVYLHRFDNIINENIKINFENNKDNDNYNSTIKEIFQIAKVDLNHFMSLDKNPRDMKLEKVNKCLNDSFEQYWQDLKISDNNKNITKRLVFEANKEVGSFSFNLYIEEIFASGKTNKFEVHHRSKGLIWFVNFILKVEYSKLKNKEAIFLLDEPGAYLHAQVQRNLAKKIEEISKKSTIIYTTHLHYLLDPEYIYHYSIMIASNEIFREDINTIRLESINDYLTRKKHSKNPNSKDKDSHIFPLEPIYNILGLNYDIFAPLKSKVVLVEGITDFRLFSLVKNENISFMPFTGANTISYYVNIFLAINKPFICLYDSDSEGKKAIEKLKEYHKEEAKFFLFHLNQLNPKIKELECIFDGKEREDMREKFNIDENKDKKTIIKQILFNLKYELKSKEDNLEDLIPKTLKTCRKIISQLEKEFSKQKN